MYISPSLLKKKKTTLVPLRVSKRTIHIYTAPRNPKSFPSISYTLALLYSFLTKNKLYEFRAPTIYRKHASHCSAPKNINGIRRRSFSEKIPRNVTAAPIRVARGGTVQRAGGTKSR